MAALCRPEQTPFVAAVRTLIERRILYANTGYSLELEGPQNSPEHLIHACYQLGLPNSPTPTSPGHPVQYYRALDFDSSYEVRERFSKIVTIAAKARTPLMRPGCMNMEKIEASYRSLVEGMAGLKAYLNTLPFEDKSFLDAA